MISARGVLGAMRDAFSGEVEGLGVGRLAVGSGAGDVLLRLVGAALFLGALREGGFEGDCAG